MRVHETSIGEGKRLAAAFAIGAGDRCGAETGNIYEGTEYVCTREHGHDGDHMAHAPGPIVVAIWTPERTYAEITKGDLGTARAITLRTWDEFGLHGLSHHVCRFCKKGIGDVRGLWKYAVRHYICEGCYKHETGKDAPTR